MELDQQPISDISKLSANVYVRRNVSYFCCHEQGKTVAAVLITFSNAHNRSSPSQKKKTTEVCAGCLSKTSPCCTKQRKAKVGGTLVQTRVQKHKFIAFLFSIISK